MYNQFEAFRVNKFTQSLSVTSVMNTYHTSVNAQLEQMDFQNCSYLNGSERMKACNTLSQACNTLSQAFNTLSQAFNTLSQALAQR